MATPTTLPATFTAGQVLTAAQMNNLRGAFRILQVVSTNKTDTFSVASATFTDVTGLSVQIAPTSTSSKVLVVAYCNTGSSGTAIMGRLVRNISGDVVIDVADAAGSRPQTTFGGNVQNAEILSSTIAFLDSPSTTSLTTYKIQLRSEGAGSTIYLNRTARDTDTANYDPRTVSNITVYEVSA